MTIAVGDNIPDVLLLEFTPGMAKAVRTEAFCKGRRVVLFSLPGAFTPVCTEHHLPGYVKLADELRANGIDDIACTAVNDFFVMNAWAQSLGLDGKLRMLADGNGHLVKALGLEEDLSRVGLGIRGQRFSMMLNDGVVEILNIESGSEFRVSAAEYLLEQLTSSDAKPNEVAPATDQTPGM